MMTIKELENEVLNIIGLSVDRGKIFDIDKGQYLLFNGKFIYVEDSSLLIHKNDIKFNIINNVKLANYLLTVLIQKEAEENGIYVKLISTGEVPSSIPSLPFCNKHNISIQLQFYNSDLNRQISETLFSDYYYNLCLAYIQMIYQISCTPLSVKLSDFDYTDDDIIEMQSRRNKR